VHPLIHLLSFVSVRVCASATALRSVWILGPEGLRMTC
jgi:hypothetical protein